VAVDLKVFAQLATKVAAPEAVGPQDLEAAVRTVAVLRNERSDLFGVGFHVVG
jgi:hypothetical protein